MTIQGTLTMEDLREAHYIALRSRFTALYWMVPIGLFVVYHDLSSWPVFCFPLFLGATALAGYAMARVMSDRSFQKYMIGANATLGPREIEVSPKGIEISSPRTFQELSWKDFRRFEIKRDLILVHYPFSYQIFPRRWFSPEQCTEFQEFLKYGRTQRPWIYIW